MTIQWTDGWERTYDLDPLDSSDGPEDADDDGYTNAQEYSQGSDPRIPAPRELVVSGQPLSGVAPLEVNFSVSYLGDVQSYLWDFGDGETSSLDTPSHVFSGGRLI